MDPDADNALWGIVTYMRYIDCLGAQLPFNFESYVVTVRYLGGYLTHCLLLVSGEIYLPRALLHWV